MSETASLSEIAQAIVELTRRDEVISMVKKKLEAGASAREILVNDLIPGLREVGRKFEEKEYFLADMLYSAITMNECMKVLEPHLLKEVEKAESAGKIVLGTVAGDIHDIGKNLFATLARAAGFEVYDLGVDVSASKFVEKVKEEHADLIEMEKMKIEKADATALTYEDNSFDISVRGFPHSPDEYTVFDMEWLKKELKKMGKTEKFSDGKIFLYAINKF